MMPARREFLILSAVAAGAALAGGVVGALTLQSRSGAAELLSSRFLDLSAQPRRVSEWQGRSLLCNFWATWCGPCREELPLLDAAQQQHTGNGLQVVGIGIDTAANIREYVKMVKVSFPLLIGDLQAIAVMRRLGNRSGGLPFTAVLDRAGRLRHRKLGAYSAAELDSEIAGLLR